MAESHTGRFLRVLALGISGVSAGGRRYNPRDPHWETASRWMTRTGTGGVGSWSRRCGAGLQGVSGHGRVDPGDDGAGRRCRNWHREALGAAGLAACGLAVAGCGGGASAEPAGIKGQVLAKTGDVPVGGGVGEVHDCGDQPVKGVFKASARSPRAGRRLARGAT